jgi:hypothetical protein
MSSQLEILPTAVVAASAVLVSCAPHMPASDVPEGQRHVADVRRAKCGN